MYLIDLLLSLSINKKELYIFVLFKTVILNKKLDFYVRKYFLSSSKLILQLDNNEILEIIYFLREIIFNDQIESTLLDSSVNLLLSLRDNLEDIKKTINIIDILKKVVLSKKDLDRILPYILNLNLNDSEVLEIIYFLRDISIEHNIKFLHFLEIRNRDCNYYIKELLNYIEYNFDFFRNYSDLLSNKNLISHFNSNNIPKLISFVKERIQEKNIPRYHSKKFLEIFLYLLTNSTLSFDRLFEIFKFLKEIVLNDKTSYYIYKKSLNILLEFINNNFIRIEYFDFIVIKILYHLNSFSPLTLAEKDEKKKKKIEEQTKKCQALNHKLLIYYFNDPELKDEFKKYSMKYNIVYYEKSDGWYCFDNYLEQEIKVPTSLTEKPEIKKKYNLINELLDYIPKDKIKTIQSLMAYNTLTKEQIAQSFELELAQVEAIYLSKQGDKYV
ncbi:MAG: hypothetical protein U0354_19845 [Candidatus Sericytochromatia bacterium]